MRLSFSKSAAARRPLHGVLVIVLAWCVTATAAAASMDDADSILPDPRETARVEASIDRGLEYLARIQNPDGSWPSPGNRNGISAFCVLAFLARGHEPGRGPYKTIVNRGIAYLISQQIETGFVPQAMYDHALSTLVMIESYGFIPTPEMRKHAQRAVDLIVKAQAPSGGWRYNPLPIDQDLSVTVMQVVALRSAQNARLDVPQKTIDGAIRFVKSVAAPAGGFGYQAPAATPAQSAAGTLCMELLGQFDDPCVAKGLEYMKVNRAAYAPGQAWFFYASYYAMQAHFQAGGTAWTQWHPKMRDQLLSTQNDDGSWPGFTEEQYSGPSKCYSTAVGTLCLSVYLHYLPAYQR